MIRRDLREPSHGITEIVAGAPAVTAEIAILLGSCSNYI
jgi:plasmid maintenance system antidote protein VapI